MSYTQTVEIPPNRRLIIDLPCDIPAGTTARFELFWFPVGKTVDKIHTTLEEIQELCKDSSLTVDSFLEMRRQDNELDEKKYLNLFTVAGDKN